MTSSKPHGISNEPSTLQPVNLQLEAAESCITRFGKFLNAAIEKTKVALEKKSIMDSSKLTIQSFIIQKNKVKGFNYLHWSATLTANAMGTRGNTEFQAYIVI